MFANAEGSSEDDGPVTVFSLAEDMLSSKQMLREFPNMEELLAISRVLPVSSVECERGFSKQNLIKTGLRCSLMNENLARLMRISINGPRQRTLTHCLYFACGVLEVAVTLKGATSSRTQKSRTSLLNRHKRYEYPPHLYMKAVQIAQYTSMCYLYFVLIVFSRKRMLVFINE